MKHIIESHRPHTATIQIEDVDNKECVITIFESGEESSCILDLKLLHSFIGTLLHVQQKIKNS